MTAAGRAKMQAKDAVQAVGTLGRTWPCVGVLSKTRV